MPLRGGSRSGHRQRRAACRCPPGLAELAQSEARYRTVFELSHWSTPRSTPSAAPGCTKAGGSKTSLATRPRSRDSRAGRRSCIPTTVSGCWPRTGGSSSPVTPGAWSIGASPRTVAWSGSGCRTGRPGRPGWRSGRPGGRVGKANVAPWRRGRPPPGERAAGGEVDIEAAVGAEPHQHCYASLGEVEGELGGVIAAVEHKQRHGLTGGQPAPQHGSARRRSGRCRPTGAGGPCRPRRSRSRGRS